MFSGKLIELENLQNVPIDVSTLQDPFEIEVEFSFCTVHHKELKTIIDYSPTITMEEEYWNNPNTWKFDCIGHIADNGFYYRKNGDVELYVEILNVRQIETNNGFAEEQCIRKFLLLITNSEEREDLVCTLDHYASKGLLQKNEVVDHKGHRGL